MKRCNKCGLEKDLIHFYLYKKNNKPRSYCKPCTNEMNKSFYKDNRDLLLHNHSIYREKNRLIIREREVLNRIRNGDAIRARDRSYWSKNKDRKLKKDKKYRKSAKGKSTRTYHSSLRRARKLQATPKWAEMSKIKKIYRKCRWLSSITGLSYHVDHVIPLVSDTVCGLHVWENLQILEVSENLKKGNGYKNE